jgi:hypothetical protein
VGIRCAYHATPSLRKIWRWLPTSGSCSVDIVRSRTEAAELLRRLKHNLRWCWTPSQSMICREGNYLAQSFWADGSTSPGNYGWLFTMYRHKYFAEYKFIFLHNNNRARARVCVCVLLVVDRPCGLVVRVPGYRSRGHCSIPDATRFSEK